MLATVRYLVAVCTFDVVSGYRRRPKKALTKALFTFALGARMKLLLRNQNSRQQRALAGYGGGFQKHIQLLVLFLGA